MNTENRTLYLKEEIKNELALEITQEQAEMLVQYYQMMVEKNKVMNLTRVTDFEEAVQKHFIDSLSAALCPKIDFRGKRILDLGCGAGFPGIPIRIVWPDCSIVLLDSVGKKVSFVNDVIRSLGLQNAEALHARAEDLARNRGYRESFDICTSRAVANMSTLTEYCLPFVKKGGFFAAYKSGESGEEIRQAEKAVRMMGGSPAEINEISVCGMNRILAVVEKVRHTPPEYPRKAGLPSKSPIA